MLTVASGVDRVFSLLQKLKFMKFDMGSVLLGAYILVCTRAVFELFYDYLYNRLME